jgi:hypothetical protein
MTHRVESPAHTDGNRPLNTRGPYFGLFLRAMRHGPRDNPWDKQTLSAFTRRNLLVSGRCGNLTSSINGCTCHGKNVCWACPYSLRTADAGIINGNSMNRFPRGMIGYMYNEPNRISNSRCETQLSLAALSFRSLQRYAEPPTWL